MRKGERRKEDASDERTKNKRGVERGESERTITDDLTFREKRSDRSSEEPSDAGSRTKIQFDPSIDSGDGSEIEGDGISSGLMDLSAMEERQDRRRDVTDNDQAPCEERRRRKKRDSLRNDRVETRSLHLDLRVPLPAIRSDLLSNVLSLLIAVRPDQKKVVVFGFLPDVGRDELHALLEMRERDDKGKGEQ